MNSQISLFYQGSQFNYLATHCLIDPYIRKVIVSEGKRIMSCVKLPDFYGNPFCNTQECTDKINHIADLLSIQDSWTWNYMKT